MWFWSHKFSDKLLFLLHFSNDLRLPKQSLLPSLNHQFSNWGTQAVCIFLINYYLTGSNEADEKNIWWKHKKMWFWSHKFNDKLLFLLHFSNDLRLPNQSLLTSLNQLFSKWGTQAVCRKLFCSNHIYQKIKYHDINLLTNWSTFSLFVSGIHKYLWQLSSCPFVDFLSTLWRRFCRPCFGDSFVVSYTLLYILLTFDSGVVCFCGVSADFTLFTAQINNLEAGRRAPLSSNNDVKTSFKCF